MKLTMTIGRIFSTFAVLFFPYSIQSATDIKSFCATGNTTEIYYVNGVWNTFKQAENGRILLERTYKQNLENQYPGQVFVFKDAYNRNLGRVQDLVELIGQKINEINDEEVDKKTPEEYLRLYMTAQSFDDNVPFTARPITATIEGYLATRVSSAVDASKHIQKYRTALLEGKRVLLVAHSQGNMFANESIFALMVEFGQSIRMIGVASPAAITYNNTPYYTAHDDRVIDALRLIQNVLPSNIDNDLGLFNDPRDFSNHKFEASYMEASLTSRALIDSEVDDAMATLLFPAPEAGDGVITATLEWGAEPDVDLHVFEPNGAHVYYINLQGISGFLDIDDVTSFGPEHYFVSCDTLEAGVYKIGVNYFFGNNPEIASVQVEAGALTRSFSIPLEFPGGPMQDESPIPVANVVVSGDRENGFEFTIEGLVP